MRGVRVRPRYGQVAINLNYSMKRNMFSQRANIIQTITFIR